MRRRDVLAGAAAVLAAGGAPAQERPVAVLAAAGLKPPLDLLLERWRGPGGARAEASYAASAAVLRQLEQGTAADLVILADDAWMEAASERKLVRADTRRDIAGDALVLIAPRESSLIEVTLAASTRLSALAGPAGRIAIGDARTVASGRHARVALISLGLMADAGPRLFDIETERALVALVARGDPPLGLVLASEARLEPEVKIVAVFPANSHPPIVISGAVTASAVPGAADLLAHLAGSEAAAIFAQAGFGPPKR